VQIELKNTDTKPVSDKQYPDHWTEIPPNGKVCAYTGLKHAKLYTMLGKKGLARPYVRVANLRDPGACQGKTIFHVGDMFRFLDALATQQGSAEENDQSPAPPK
jgi:hypothetical protein